MSGSEFGLQLSSVGVRLHGVVWAGLRCGGNMFFELNLFCK